MLCLFAIFVSYLSQSSICHNYAVWLNLMKSEMREERILDALTNTTATTH